MFIHHSVGFFRGARARAPANQQRINHSGAKFKRCCLASWAAAAASSALPLSCPRDGESMCENLRTQLIILLAVACCWPQRHESRLAQRQAAAAERIRRARVGKNEARDQNSATFWPAFTGKSRAKVSGAHESVSSTPSATDRRSRAAGSTANRSRLLAHLLAHPALLSGGQLNSCCAGARLGQTMAC